METTFDFTKHDEYTHTINSSGKLWIKRMSHAVAVLYFTDEMNNKINISDDIVVYTYDFQDKKKIIDIDNYYLFRWSDNYTIEYKKIELLTFNSQKKI